MKVTSCHTFPVSRPRVRTDCVVLCTVADRNCRIGNAIHLSLEDLKMNVLLARRGSTFFSWVLVGQVFCVQLSANS